MAKTAYTSPSSGVTTETRPYVQVKRYWADSWMNDAFLIPVSMVDRAGPSLSEATFLNHYGRIQWPGMAIPTAWRPIDYFDCYVRVCFASAEGDRPIWHGIFTDEMLDIHGAQAHGVSGDQLLRAHGLERKLDRLTVVCSWCSLTGMIGPDVHQIYRALVFNPDRPGKSGSVGNRTLYENEEEGVYLFSANARSYWEGYEIEAAAWTNLDILRYLLHFYVDTQLDFSFGLSGEYANLDLIVACHDFEGLSIRQAINRLIDRRLGLIWSVRVVDGTPYIHVSSAFGEEVALTEEESIAPNPEQFDLNADNALEVEHLVSTLHRADSYDRIVVLGEPLEVCLSLSFTEGSLAKGWPSALETEYKLDPKSSDQDDEKLNDEARRTDRYRAVYQRFLVPITWDGTSKDGLEDEAESRNNALPIVTPLGVLDVLTQTGIFFPEKRFLRFLPLTAEGTDELLPPVAFIQDPADSHYMQIDAPPDDEEEEKPSAQLRMLDDDLGVEIRTRVPHIYGLNHFDQDEGDPPVGAKISAIEPVFDYTKLIATVCLPLDQRILFIEQVHNVESEVECRTMYVYVDEARMTYIVPGTSYKVEAGALVSHEGGLVRDDSEKLIRAAKLAAAWYGKTRTSIRLSLKGVHHISTVGNYIKTMGAWWRSESVETVVTSIAWRFSTSREGKAETEITTAWQELDAARIVEFIGHGSAKGLVHSIRQMRRDTKEAQNRFIQLDDRRPATGSGGAGGAASYDRAVYTGDT